ncbi:tyrosine-type recombinase/integrase [Falsiroseomonas tokyonensis]|uniref:Tyrosine-type recombinase/integrase n=1 Tax=Falsiroseomonas tokyonensis TaxID=430521 RepID=A0ABV7BYD5_9PROT|nr:site-specific integrase [Falsiroseomonas tokyonensis]
MTVAGIKAKPPGRYGDGNGLYLLVRSAKVRFWLFRYTPPGGKMREMGLGAVALEEGKAGVTLADARLRAAALRNMLRQGIDPLDAEREAERVAAEAAKAAAAAPTTFRTVAETMLAEKEAEWSNPKHRQQWRNTLATYAYPVIGDLPVGTLGTADILRVLRPIWATKPETAARVKMRVLAVLRYATAAGERPNGASAADIDEALRTLLPKSAALKRAAGYGHHPALPWGQMGAFMAALRQRDATAARALEFLALTATRTGETLGARWHEIDLAGRVWAIPAERMKGRRPHRVPLSDAAVSVLERMQEQAGGKGSPVFPGDKPGEPLSQMALLMLLRRMNPAEEGDGGETRHRWQDATTGDPITAHGFRSTFRDWAGEATSTPHAVMEAALAHKLGDKVEASYARGDLLQKRRVLMDAWAEHCARAPAAVVALRQPVTEAAAAG